MTMGKSEVIFYVMRVFVAYPTERQKACNQFLYFRILVPLTENLMKIYFLSFAVWNIIESSLRRQIPSTPKSSS